MRALWLAVFFTCSCAKMGPPQGGPVDKTAPQILSYAPARDALTVPLNSVVEIVFSEAMDRERTEEAIFVSPAGPLDFVWRGRTLRVRVALRPQRTYVATVGTGARDLRGNALEKSFSLAFSTGSQLDQGSLSGRVYREHAPERGAHVWVYDLANFSGEIGIEPPAYQTQSGADGQYEFMRLAPGAYRLLAFVDADRDIAPDADEWVALPAADVLLGDSPVLAGDLLLAQRQIAEADLERIQAVHERMLLLIFSRAVDPSQVALRIAGLAIGPFYTGTDSSKIYALTAQQEAGRNYAVERAELAGRALKWKEPIRGSGRSDRKAPLALGLAAERVLPNEPVEVVFNEAMDAQRSAEANWVGDSTLVLSGQWLSPTRVSFAPVTRWRPGRQQLALRGVDWVDQAGNSIADSSLVLDFEVVEATTTLRGRIAGAEAAVEIRAANVKATRRYAAQRGANGQFLISGILPDEYLLWAFADKNGDGVWNAGALKPFVRPEAYARYEEPVSLEAGQRSEEIEWEFR